MIPAKKFAQNLVKNLVIMSELLTKLVNLFKTAILKVNNIRDFRRLLKWAVVVTTILIWYLKFKTIPHDNIVMMPDWHPIFGHFIKVTSHFEDVIQYTYELAKKADFPKCVALSGYRRLYGVMILDPEIAKHVFDTKFESFKKGDRIQMELEEMLGDGIFTSDPPKWKFHRKSYVSQMYIIHYLILNLYIYIFSCIAYVQHEESQKLYV